MKLTIDQIVEGISGLTGQNKIEAYNRIQVALRNMISGITLDPACTPELVGIDQIQANDYNPNRVATVELDLLRQSIEADGITMPIVVSRNETDDGFVVVDGFHRHTVAKAIGRKYVPCSIIDSDLSDRMASTVRHNRARGKHQVDLMAHLVRTMMQLGWDDAKIAEAMGMSPEEMLRLRQMVGAARILAGDEYSQSWGRIEEPS